MQQGTLDLSVSPTYHREDFYVSQSNRDAYKLILEWPNWPAPFLILHGPKGCGKTHLSHIWAEKAKAARLNPKDMNLATIDELCTHHDAVVLEDLDENIDEEMLFHLFNAAKNGNVSLLITSENAPSQWSLDLPDLKSRVGSALWIEIEPADDDLLHAMAQKVFSDQQIAVSDKVITYLINHQDRSFAALQSSIKRINQHALATQRRITLPLVREILATKKV